MNKSSGRQRDSANPLVSIVTPSFNQAQFIEKTIRSVVLQDYVNLEYFVLDAMSKDGTEEILNKYSGSITKAIRAKDDGQSDAINKGFALSSGEIMAYLNSDDCYSSPHTVSRVVELFQEHPDVDVIYGKREYIDEAGYFALNYPFREFDASRLLEACYIPQECVFWRRSIYEKAGNKVDKGFMFAMDYDLWLRFLAAGAKFLAVDEYFGLFRWYPGQKSNDVWIKHGLPEIARLQEQHLGKALPEDEMTAFYQEYWYGVNRLDKMRTFSQSVRVWNTFIANKKEMLKGLTRDAWVFMNQLEIPQRVNINKEQTHVNQRSVDVPRNANSDGNYANFKNDVQKYSLFDSRYYAMQTAENNTDLLKHYYTSGWKLGLNPHPLFDTNYYLNANQDVQASGGNPLEHWLNSGASEGRDPHPLFNLKIYRDCSGVKADAASLINHYQAVGWKDGLSPHSLFDTNFYNSSYEKWSADGYSDPLSHYIARGGKDLKEPNGLFDSKFFAKNNPDLKATACCLIQFVTQSSNGNCHPLFDAAYYEQQLQSELTSKWEAVQHYLLHGSRSLDPHPLFSTQHYLKMNPCVAAAGFNPLAHYLANGHHENRSPHPLFESSYVMAQMASVKGASSNALVSFVSAPNFSFKPHPLFDPEFYSRQVDKSLTSSWEALAHYWVYGWRLGLNPHPLINTLYYQRRLGLTTECGIEPIAHYREFGHRDKISPHALFDYEHFSKDAARVPAAPTALEQFLLCDTVDVESHPLFSARHYLDQSACPNTRAADVLIDYCERGWKLAFDPYPLFDVSYYADSYAQTEPLAHYLEFGYKSGLNPHPLFDTEFYLFQRPSLRNGYMSPLMHYVLRGLRYKVSPHRLFDTIFYEQIEPVEICDPNVPPLVRYLKHWYHSGIDPNPAFDTDYYRSLNPDLREGGLDPLSHFLANGGTSRVTLFYEKQIDSAARFDFLEACGEQVVWNFLDRGAVLSVDESSEHVAFVEITPTDEKFRDGCEKIRGLRFEIHRGDVRHELCFNPRKQISEIRELLAECGVAKLVLHNFFSIDREYKTFLDNLKSPYCIFIGKEHSETLEAATFKKSMWEELASILDDYSLGSGAEFKPATRLNWQISRSGLLDGCSAVYIDSQVWAKFFDDCFPNTNVVRKSFLELVNELAFSRSSAQINRVTEISSKRKITLGLPCLPGGGWTGGMHYLNSLLKAASSVESDFDIETVLIAKRDSDWQGFAGSLHGWKKVFEISDLYASSEIDALGLDCIFSAGGALGRCETPLISWLYDFQHMEMPQFFSPGDIVERNRLFEKVVQDSSRIILSSKHAQSICSNNFPQATERTRVLSFVPALSDASFSTDTRYVRAKYGLNECFFYLPNQFWLHKNHDVVVKAIAELKAQGKDLMVVCTGATSDVRDDKHFPELLRQIAASGMRNSFLVLGMVPRQDVVALMRECRAVIQPSLYEGWSTSVEEAKAFEVPIILSDIPVHREQAPAKCDYFPPLDFRSLATLLKDYSEVSSEPAARLEQALETHLKSFEKFGYQFKGVVSELIFNMAMY